MCSQGLISQRVDKLHRYGRLVWSTLDDHFVILVAHWTPSLNGLSGKFRECFPDTTIRTLCELLYIHQYVFIYVYCCSHRNVLSFR